MEEIAKGNFVYIPFYKLAKTHLSEEEQRVGAIIVGTQDKELNKWLCFMFMRNLMTDYKK